MLTLALTDLIATDLLRFEDMQPDATIEQHLTTTGLMASPSLASVDAVIVAETIDAILEALVSEDRTVLLSKMAGDADGQIAERLSMSRPTVAKKKTHVLGVLRGQLEGLSEHAQREVTDGLYVRLVEELT